MTENVGKTKCIIPDMVSCPCIKPLNKSENSTKLRRRFKLDNDNRGSEIITLRKPTTRAKARVEARVIDRDVIRPSRRFIGVFDRTGQIENGMKATFAEPESRAEQHADPVAGTTAALGTVYAPLLMTAVLTQMKGFNHLGVNEHPSIPRSRWPPCSCFLTELSSLYEFKCQMSIIYSFDHDNAFR